MKFWHSFSIGGDANRGSEVYRRVHRFDAEPLFLNLIAAVPIFHRKEQKAGPLPAKIYWRSFPRK